MKYLHNEIFEVVRNIPKGRVMTYGQIARMVGTGPRVVGNVLHTNPDPISIPCHRVVNFKGKVAPAYAFGGELSQIEHLREEGIKFNNGKVDLKIFGLKENK